MSGFDDKTYEVEGINPLTGDTVFELPRVTSILSQLAKPALKQWAANVAADKAIALMQEDGPQTLEAIRDEARYAYKSVSDDAVDLGSELHDYLEKVNRLQDGGDMALPAAQDIASGWVHDYVEWFQKVHLKPLLVEQRLVGPGYAGTVDLVAECDYAWFTSRDKALQKETRKKRVVLMIDFKTGKGTNYPEWGLQTAAYRHALELQGQHIDVNAALRFNKINGKMARVADHSMNYKRDLEMFFCLRDYHWLKGT